MIGNRYSKFGACGWTVCVNSVSILWLFNVMHEIHCWTASLLGRDIAHFDVHCVILICWKSTVSCSVMIDLKKKKNSTTCPLHIIFEDWMQVASLFSVNIIQLRGFSMSVPKDQPLVSDSMKKVGAVVTVSVAVLAAKHFWHCWWLNRKLEKKRESCRKTLQTVQQQLQQVLCWLHLLIFCYCVVLTACW